MVRNERGFTLIELLAVMVIFMMLMAAVSFMFIFSQRLFIASSQQSSLHGDLRLTAERVGRELRFAYFLEIIDEEDWDLEAIDSSEYSYIYFDRSSRTIILLDDSGSRSLSSNTISDVSFVGNVSTLLFTLHGESGGEAYSLDSSVRLLNYRCNFHNPDNPIALRYSLDPEFVP